MKFESIAFCLNSVNMRVETNHKAFYQYLSLYFKQVRVSADQDPQICIKVNWQKKPMRLELDQGISIGANTLFRDNAIATIRKINRSKKIRLAFSLHKAVLSLDAGVLFDPAKDYLRYQVLHQPQEALFCDLVWPLVYYPFFWYLEHFKGVHLLHASAVTVQGKCMVMCGLEGMGKTTVSLSLLREKDSLFFSDNLVLYDDQQIYPCFEPIRIHKGEDPTLWAGRFERIERLRSMKDFYAPISRVAAVKGRPDIFIIPAFGKAFSARQASREQFVNQLTNLNQLTAELGNYNEYAAMMSLLDLDYQLYTSRYQRLQKLLSNVRCMHVTMCKSDGVAVNMARLKDVILAA